MRLMRHSLMLLIVLAGSANADTLDDRLPNAAGIATAHPLATAAGEEIMRAGGNAFDAAVAITAALAVVEPYGSGLGGGGFWLLHLAEGKEVMIDGRERAPLAATRDMYLDADGQPISKLSRDGALAAGIPGTPAAMAHMASRNFAGFFAQSPYKRVKSEHTSFITGTWKLAKDPLLMIIRLPRRCDSPLHRSRNVGLTSRVMSPDKLIVSS